MADGRDESASSSSRSVSSPVGYAVVLVVGLASAVATTVGVSRPWVAASASVQGLPTIRAQVDGADLAPLAGALGFVLLASFGAVIATRGTVRRALGVVVVVCAVVVVVTVVHPGDAARAAEQGLSAKGWSGGSYRTSTPLWRWVAGVGGAGCLLAGALIAWFGGVWVTMSTRYDAPSSKRRQLDAAESDPSEADLWRSIDRGHDPTQAP